MKIRIATIATICIIMTLFSFKGNDKIKVIIDAGHGGKDFGAVSADLKEKDIVRSIADQIVKANHNPNIEFFVIGEEDVFIDMAERIRAINSLNGDILISLHVSASPNKHVRGTSIIVSPKNKEYEKSRKIAKNILDAIPQMKGVENKIIDQDLTVLKGVNCAAITYQMGYISNSDDVKIMTSETGQRELANYILNNLVK